MNDEIKEIYLCNLEWIKTHDNIGGVMGILNFKDNMLYEEYQRLFKNIHFVLCNKDYITNLQQENKRLKQYLDDKMKDLQNIYTSYIRLQNTYDDLYDKYIDNIEGRNENE